MTGNHQATGSSGLGPGQGFATASGRIGRVEALLGAGGQGEVYSVWLDGQLLALKWYHPHYVAIDTMLRARLERSVRRGAPTGDFLWPLDLVDIPGSASFGYVMPLRSSEFVSIRDLIAPPPRRLDLPIHKRTAICLHLARSFLELHASGFCYQDLNFGNIFLEPATGRVLICDNDNVNIDGADASVYGTRKFMAPEVVRRETLPNSRTDLFSMSVLFFYVLFAWHPLDGRREAETNVLDAAAELRLYGADPLFIFDPANNANGPVAGLHDPIVARWNSLPQAMRDLFTRAFTIGLTDPSSRVLETEWREALVAMRDASFSCPACGFEQVCDVRRRGPGQSQTALAPNNRCMACDTVLDQPACLLIGDCVVALTVGVVLAAEILDGAAGAGKVAQVEAHPTKPDRLGLRNLTQSAWQVTLADGATYTVDPGQVVRILDGAGIAFGELTGRICGGATLVASASQ